MKHILLFEKKICFLSVDVKLFFQNTVLWVFFLNVTLSKNISLIFFLDVKQRKGSCCEQYTILILLGS